MKERSKGKMAELLLEELLEQLKERGTIKEKLGDMTSLPVEELIEQLLDEFEGILEKRRLRNVDESRARSEQRSKPKQESPSFTRPLFEPSPEPLPAREPQVSLAQAPIPASPKLPSHEESRTKEAPKETVTTSAKRIDKFELEFAPIPLHIPSLDPETTVRPTRREPAPVDKELPKPSDKETKPSLREKEVAQPRREPERLTEPEPPSRKPKIEERFTPPPGIEAEDDLDEELDVESEAEVEPLGGQQHEMEVSTRHSTLAKLAYEFTDNDHVYLHAVVPIPQGEEPSEKPFMLEEKGIDGKNFAFALDYEGLRFYLSKFSPEIMSVSKKGVLLLGKQETLQFQGVHESILNDLRIHRTLLPFKFGMVARGKDRLLGMIDEHSDDIRESLASIDETKWWTLNLYVLDARIAQLVGSQSTPRGREREQQRVSVSQAALMKKYDVKTLERILQKEKKIAETIHEEMKKYAERSDIDSMVSLGSGSSEDWKLILKASYEVAEKNLPRFNRMVTDLQYHHIMFDPMLALTGDVDAYSFE